jgi:uncharacterized protein (TIGR03083 family)
MGSVGEDFVRERDALRETLTLVGPDAPTTCGSWTTTDLAVHVAGGELAWAVPNAPFRLLVGRGVRLDRLAPFNDRALDRERRRHGFDWAMERLRRNAPKLHTYGSVAAVSVLEMWAHHEDVLRANAVGPCTSGVRLGPVVVVLVRYQRKFLTEHGVRVCSSDGVRFAPTTTKVEVSGAGADVARWLSGRGRLDALSVSGDEQAAQTLRDISLSI